MQLSRDSIFRGVSELALTGLTDDDFKSVGAMDHVVIGAVTASYWENTLTC